MANLIPLAPADVETQLGTAIAVAGTSFTLSNATDDDGNALAAGLYCFTIDNGKSNKEYLIGTLSGTSVTSVSNVSRQGVSSSGAVRAHRVGAPVIISNFASLQRAVDALRGQVALDSTTPMLYDGDPTLTLDAEIATKKYADDLAIAGSPNSSDSVKGISKLSVAAASPTDPIAVGDNDGRVPTQDENDSLAGNGGTPSSTNLLVSQQGMQEGSEVYAADAGGTDAYAITLSPTLGSYTTGQVFRFKANTTNTGAATLNVDSVGAVTIKKLNDQDLSDGDIEAGQIVTVAHDGTNFQMQSQVSTETVVVETFTSSGTWNKPNGTKRAYVQVWAGGGGGATSNDSSNTIATGGGGGVYTWGWYDAADLGASETVTVGAGGATIAAGNNVTGNNGVDSSFGSLLVAAGGKGGVTSSTNAAGGNGGKLAGMEAIGSPLFGEGVANVDGEPGLYTGAGGGGATNADGGNAYYGGGGGGGDATGVAGTSVMSGDGGAGATTASATAGVTPSGGGGGCNSTSAAHFSGAGGDGQIIVTSYL